MINVVQAKADAEAALARKGFDILQEVLAERLRQNVKFAGWTGGVQRHNILTWSCVLSEESGEVSQASLDVSFGAIKDLAHAREELIQTAAVAFAIIERIDAHDHALLASEGTYKNG